MLTRTFLASAFALLLQMITSSSSLGQNVGTPTGALPISPAWPPTIDPKNTTVRSVDGRVIERFIHGPRPEWGYSATDGSGWAYPVAQETGAEQQNHNSFYLVAPKIPRDNAPLCVVLHSANRTAYDYLGYGSLDRKIDGNDDPVSVMTKSPDDFYALYLNSTNSEWWGWTQARQNSDFAQNINTPPPAERRVLDTIDWVANKYKIDRNRIYLCGVSMGGCGTLGLGLPHGDVFAAMLACVPAGTNYVSYRMGGLGPVPAQTAPQSDRNAWIKRASAVGLPDPPVLVDFSSQEDAWSQTQPALVDAAQAGHLALVLTWGRFGHTTFADRIMPYPICQVALAYPWLEIRKNEAYPVFTHATCDQPAPWLNAPVEFDDSGQMNAYFRWKNEQDTPSHFTMQLWIAHPTTTGSPAPTMPDSATADITLRRFQQFKIPPLGSCSWQASKDGKVIAAGKIKSDAVHLLTISQVALSTSPIELSLDAEP